MPLLANVLPLLVTRLLKGTWYGSWALGSFYGFPAPKLLVMGIGFLKSLLVVVHTPPPSLLVVFDSFRSPIQLRPSFFPRSVVIFFFGFSIRLGSFELELELTQTRVIQKPLLWVEVGKSACVLVGICELRLSLPARYDPQYPSLLNFLSGCLVRVLWTCLSSTDPARGVKQITPYHRAFLFLIKIATRVLSLGSFDSFCCGIQILFGYVGSPGHLCIHSGKPPL